MNDIDTLMRAIDIAPQAPDESPGARELRTAIMAEERGAANAEPRHSRGFRPRMPVRWLTVAAALAVSTVVGPSLLKGGSGVTPSYAVIKDANGIVYVTVRDFSDAAGLRRQLRDLDVPAIVDHVPYGKKCREPRGTYVEPIPAGLYSVPENIPGERQSTGWRMRIDTRLFKPGQTFVWTITDMPDGGSGTSTILMTGPVTPCVLVPDDSTGGARISPYRTATLKGRSLGGFRVDGKTVGDVLPELKRRGLAVKFLIMGIPPGNPGGYVELRTQDTPVRNDWIVWEAQESIREHGVIRLLVTHDRYDKNPVYGGPRDDVIKE